MSPSQLVRAALLAALRADPAFAGVDGFDRVGGARPGVRVSIADVADWSTKTEAGRDVRSVVALTASAGQEARLDALITAAERAGVGLGGDIGGGWHVASATLFRTRMTSDAGGLNAAVEHRIAPRTISNRAHAGTTWPELSSASA